MLNNLIKLFGYGCLHCGIATADKKHIFCQECENVIQNHTAHGTSAVISAISYSSSEQAKTLIRYMKDYNDPYVFDYAASLLEAKLRKTGICERLSDFRITYAPRNPVTFLKRHFDQSKEIADFLAARLFEDDTGKVISLFGRTPFASEQKKLDLLKRAENAENLFRLKRSTPIPERLIIVDDLCTTGATLFTLKDIALGAGVKECILCSVAANDRRIEL